MVFTDRFVGDGPSIRSSNGTTKFTFPRPGAGLDTPPKKDIHDATSYGQIYVNELGRAAMLSAKPATFPVGSMIVREKLQKKDDVRPLLLAAMIKRPSGFSPKTGDWEYLILDGAVTKVRERHKKGACLDCHESQRARDFVFGDSWIAPAQ